MLDKRELLSREKLIKEFVVDNPDYVKVEEHPERQLLEWAIQKKYVIPVVVGGIEFVNSMNLEQAKVWHSKDNSFDKEFEDK